MKRQKITLLVNIFFILFIVWPAAAQKNETSGAITIPFGDNVPAGVSYYDGYDFYCPYGFKISPDGSLFISNTLKNSIMQFDFMGRLTKSYSGPDDIFKTPGDLTFDSDGMLYFANLEKTSVMKIDMLSAPKQQFGGYGDGDEKLLSIFQIEIAPGKKLFVEDIVSAKINVYSSTGAFIKKVDCNVPGFAINLKGQLLFFKFDGLMGYSLYLLEANSKVPAKIFDIGLSEAEGFGFIGIDYAGNVYVSINAGAGQRDVLIYNPRGVLSAVKSVKASPLVRQFFVFGDGSLYSAEVDYRPSGTQPLKISIRKY